MVGRQQEIKYLRQLCQSDSAEMVAIVGRRRVGKTFLVRNVFEKQMVFEFSGTQHVSRANQLKKFALKISEYQNLGFLIQAPTDWGEAFNLLKTYLLGLSKSKQKQVIFFDELPWIATARSGFLEEFAYWWNDWASRQNLMVIICGSAAAWMIKKVISNKGGLHNRISAKIDLQPFTLAETKELVQRINPALNNYQILQLYMSIGGIPYYLQQLHKGESATQTINRLCFQKDGFLRLEFENLYAALYDDYEHHIEIIKVLATKWKGLTRQEIIKHTRLSDGGGLTKILTELSASSFIISILPFGKKKKDTLYRLVDEYSLFYLKFIEGQRAKNQDVWLQLSKENPYTIWRGYAFENICIKHVEAIKMALGISGVRTNTSSFLAKKGDTIQIDMLIDRADNCINLCEMKFYSDELLIDKQLAAQLQRRRTRFQELSGSRKTLFNTLVTTFGVRENEHSLAQVDQVVTADELFKLQSF